MGIVSKGIISAVEQGVPSFAMDHCLNRRQTRHPCTLCHDRCPQQAIPVNPVTEKIDWSKCTSCGLCVSACPSRCFAPEIKQRQNMTAPERGSRVAFSCVHTKVDVGGRKMECLCGIPWEWMAALTMRMPVLLYTGECETCPMESCKAQLIENLQQLKAFLGDERFEARVILTDDAADLERCEEETAVSRRALFAMLGKRVKSAVAAGVSSAMPSPKDDPARDGFAYRKLLAGMVYADCAARCEEAEKENRPAVHAQYNVLLPDFGFQCYGCEVCMRVCPQQALSIREETDKTSIISIEPVKCTGCGLCQAVCLHGGITEMAFTPVYHLEKQDYVRVYHENCAGCGTAIARDTEDGYCIACSVKKKQKGRR